MATDVILMQCVKAGRYRQVLHEDIREHSMLAGKRVKEEGASNDLLERIAGDPLFAAVHDHLDTLLDPMGKKLSESLKKKILLIRATVGKKSLLLLEEPWNGLPIDLQVKMKDYFLNELPNSTVIIATNDAEYIQKCTVAFEIKNGVILD